MILLYTEMLHLVLMSVELEMATVLCSENRAQSCLLFCQIVYSAPNLGQVINDCTLKRGTCRPRTERVRDVCT